MDQHQQQQQRITVDLNSCEDVKCLNCETTTFIQIMKGKIIPALMSPTGKDQPHFMPLLICAKCNTYLDLNKLKASTEEKKSSLIL